jgi:hypothetical protein
MNTMTEEQIGRLVLKQLGGRSFITIYEAIALVGVALAEQGRLGDAAAMGTTHRGSQTQAERTAY